MTKQPTAQQEQELDFFRKHNMSSMPELEYFYKSTKHFEFPLHETIRNFISQGWLDQHGSNPIRYSISKRLLNMKRQEQEQKQKAEQYKREIERKKRQEEQDAHRKKMEQLHQEQVARQEQFIDSTLYVQAFLFANRGCDYTADEIGRECNLEVKIVNAILYQNKRNWELRYHTTKDGTRLWVISLQDNE